MSKSVDEITQDYIKSRVRYINFKIAYEDINKKLVPIVGSFANPLIIYLKMRSRIVRDGWIDYAGYPIKENYYDRGYLAMSMSMRKMAEEFAVNVKSIRKAVQLMIQNGWLKVERHKAKDTYLGQYIYIFGRWWREDDGKIRQNYYNNPFEEF